jgi:hypothetical protein
MGLKGIYRMIAWPTGTFELNPPETREFEKPLDVSVQEVLMEGFRQKDEYEQLRPRMPAWDEKLLPARPMGVKLRDLKPEELDVFQCALEGQTVGGTLDISPQSDLETARALLELIGRGYLRSSDSCPHAATRKGARRERSRTAPSPVGATLRGRPYCGGIKNKSPAYGQRMPTPMSNAYPVPNLKSLVPLTPATVVL